MTAPRILDDAPVNRVHVTVPASLAITLGDLIYATGSSGVHRPLSSLADQLTPGGNYATVAPLVVGIAADSRTTGETAARSDFPVDTACEVEMDCSSATFEPGDFVGPVEAGSGTALESQKVAKTTSRAFAIGKVTKRYASATTRVQFQLFGSVQNPSSYKPFPVGVQPATEILAGDRVLTAAEVQQKILRFDPAAARNMDLPPAADCAGVQCWIKNMADAAEIITIRLTGGGATVCTPTQNETAVLVCDGVDWFATACFHN